MQASPAGSAPIFAPYRPVLRQRSGSEYAVANLRHTARVTSSERLAGQDPHENLYVAPRPPIVTRADPLHRGRRRNPERRRQGADGLGRRRSVGRAHEGHPRPGQHFLRDGGVIVIGKGELTPGKFALTTVCSGRSGGQLRGHQGRQARVNSSLCPHPSTSASTGRSTGAGSSVVLTVREFDDVPVICTKSFELPAAGGKPKRLLASGRRLRPVAERRVGPALVRRGRSGVDRAGATARRGGDQLPRSCVQLHAQGPPAGGSACRRGVIRGGAGADLRGPGIGPCRPAGRWCLAVYTAPRSPARREPLGLGRHRPLAPCARRGQRPCTR